MNQMIIGLVGETGSGKDTVADYLHDKYGAKLMRFADPIKSTLSIYFDKLSKADQQWFYHVFRQRFGEDILCRAMKKHLERETAQLVIINGLRMPCDYDFIKSYPHAKILYVTADRKIRWQRVASRGEKTDDNVPFDKFEELDMKETEVHIPEIGKKADRTIVNEKDLEYLLSEADKFMEGLETEKKQI